jgi:hypothetical protein
MSSKRFAILQQVESLLSNISIANGFPLDLADDGISHEQLDINDLHSEDTPHISLSIGSGGANSFITTGSSIDSVLNIILDSYIVVQPGIDVVENLDQLLYSIEFAIFNGTPNTPWNDKYKTASLGGVLTYVYSVSFDEQFNTDEGLLSLMGKAYARWSLTISYLRSTINP